MSQRGEALVPEEIEDDSCLVHYPLVNSQFAIEAMAIEILDLPMKYIVIHSSSQNVSLPEGNFKSGVPEQFQSIVPYGYETR